MDFAGGTVVHINAGIAALAAALVIGRREGYGKEAFIPHNLPMTILGAGLLWFGWFGFNAGSALAADGLATTAFIATHLATSAALLSWCAVEWLVRGKATTLGVASGAVAGLVAVTPAAELKVENPQFSFTTDILSQYVFRAVAFSREGVVFQPSVTVSYKGFAFNIWGNFDSNERKPKCLLHFRLTHGYAAAIPGGGGGDNTAPSDRAAGICAHNG